MSETGAAQSSQSCPACGREVAAQLRRCPGCGAWMRPWSVGGVASIRHGGEYPLGGDFAPPGSAGGSQWVQHGQGGPVRRPDQVGRVKPPKPAKERRRRQRS